MIKFYFPFTQFTLYPCQKRFFQIIQTHVFIPIITNQLSLSQLLVHLAHVCHISFKRMAATQCQLCFLSIALQTLDHEFKLVSQFS